MIAPHEGLFNIFYQGVCMLGDNFVSRKISVKDVNMPEFGTSIYNFIGKDVPTLRFNNAVSIMEAPGYWACTIWFTNKKEGETSELEYISNLFTTYKDQVGFVVEIIRAWIEQNGYDLNPDDVTGEHWFTSFTIRRLTNKEMQEFESYGIEFSDAEGIDEIHVDFHIPRKREMPYLRIMNKKPNYADCYNRSNKKSKR